MARHTKEAFMALIVLTCSMFDGALAVIVLFCMLIAATIRRARRRNRVTMLGPPAQHNAEPMIVSVATEPQGLITLGLMPCNTNSTHPASSKTTLDSICQSKATTKTSTANPSADIPEVTVKTAVDEGLSNLNVSSLDANSLWSESWTGCRGMLADPRLPQSTNPFFSESQDRALATKKTLQKNISELEALTTAKNGTNEDAGSHTVDIPLPGTSLIDSKPAKESFSSPETVRDGNGLEDSSGLEHINNTSPDMPPVEATPLTTVEDENENPDNAASSLRLRDSLTSTRSPSVYYETGRRLALKRLKFVVSDHTSDLKNADPTESASREENTVERDSTTSKDQDIILLSPEQLSWLTSKKYLRLCREKSKRSNRETSHTPSYIKGGTVADCLDLSTLSKIMNRGIFFQPPEAPDTEPDSKHLHSPGSVPKEGVPPTKPTPSIQSTPSSPPCRSLERFPLFDLPREIRDLVYGFAVGGKLLHFSGYDKKPYQLCIEAEQEKRRNHWRCFACSKRQRWNQVLPIIPLLLTSKQVHREVLPIVYGTNYFSFLNFNALKNFNSKYSRRTKIANLGVPQRSSKASPKGLSASDNEWLLDKASPTGTRTRRVRVCSPRIDDAGRLDRWRRGNQVFSGIRVYDPAAKDRQLSLIRFDLEFFAWLDASRPQPKVDTLCHISDYPSQDFTLAFQYSRDELNFATQVQEYREHRDFLDKTHSARIILVSGNIPESTNLRAIDRTIYRILGNMTYFVPHLQDLTGEVRCDVKGLDALKAEDTRARDLGLDRNGEDCRGSEIVRRGDAAFCDFVVKVLTDKLKLDDCFRFWHVYGWKDLEALPELYVDGKPVEGVDDGDGDGDGDAEG